MGSLDAKEGHVEEISMDDFMDTLIEALDTDADVFESDRQITSDPWFGKQKFSLGPNGIKFADPMDIFNDIYGNPGFGVPGGIGPYGPFGGRGPFGSIGRMKPYGKSSYGGYGKGGFGLGGYGGYGKGGFGTGSFGGYGSHGGYGMGRFGGYGGYGKGAIGGNGMGGFWTPYGFSNYGPGPHGPQDYDQQPPASDQQPLPTGISLDISHPITGISPSTPSNLRTSYLVTLGHLPMDSSLLTLKMQLLDPDLPGSGSALPWIIVSYGYLS